MATYEQVIEALRRADASGNVEDARHLATIAQGMKQTTPPQVTAPEEPGTMGKIARGVGQGAMDVMETVYKPGSWVQEKMLDAVGLKGPDRQKIMQQADASRERYDKQYGDSFAAGAGRVGGQLAASLPAMAAGGAVAGGLASSVPALAPAASFLSGEGGLASKVAAGALQGGEASALTSSASENPGRDIVLGAALGGAIPLVWGGAKAAGRALGNAAAPVSRMTPEAVDLAKKAASEGIDINAAQLTDSPWLRVVDSATRKVPFSGASKELSAQQSQFNRAVAKRIGVDADKITPEVYAAAKQQIGSEFERLSAQNSLPLTSELVGSLKAVQDDAAKFATDDTTKAVGSAIDELISKSESGIVPGKAYQALDSKLGKLLKGGGEKAHYLGQVRDAVRGAMDEAISPEDQAAWQLARGQYKNLKTIRDLVAKESVDGNINPAQLLGRLTSTGAGKEAMASGRAGDLTDLAKIGQRFLKDTVPNSGTAERSLYYNALAGTGTAMNPVMGGVP